MKKNANEINLLNPVAQTSLLVAAMRAVESKRSLDSGRLFSDPFAEILAGDLGFSIMNKAIETVGDQPAIAVRTAYMDEKYMKALNEGIKQIVILAAGMDARAYRLNFPEDVTVFELDQESVLNYKKHLLRNYQPKCKRIEIATDLREDWTKNLLENGLKIDCNTLWSVEGLLMYLDEFEVKSIIEKINTLAIKNDMMIFDIFTKDLLEAPYMQKQLEFLSELGAPWKFGTNDPENFMKNLGWDTELIQPGEYAPSRWPFPVAPRHIPNVPRSFFGDARKI